MTKKLSRYAAKVRAGICPSRYGTFYPMPPMRADEAKAHEAATFHRALGRNGWRKPLVRIVRHQGLIGGERRLIPLTQAELRATR